MFCLKTEFYILVLLPFLDFSLLQKPLFGKMISQFHLIPLYQLIMKLFVVSESMLELFMHPPCIGSTVIANLLCHQVSSSTLSLMLIFEIGPVFSCH